MLKFINQLNHRCFVRTLHQWFNKKKPIFLDRLFIKMYDYRPFCTFMMMVLYNNYCINYIDYTKAKLDGMSPVKYRHYVS